MEKYILETRNLTKKFGSQIAVDGLSIKVKENSVFGLLGPNGAGKSTILKMITGMSFKSSGQIFFDGHEFSRKDLKYIGALIENPPLYENLTARENLKVRSLLLGLDEARIDQVLDIVDLKNTGNKKSGKFSLGMKERLGIAIALMNNPKLLILDEPTNGLDPLGIQELRELIRSFPKKGITVILSSHILAEVEQSADYIAIIDQGRLIYQNPNNHQGNLEEIFMKAVKKGVSNESLS
jgi:gallidermin-class lantibiotic protection ABC transporter ATP-binding subunit